MVNDRFFEILTQISHNFYCRRRNSCNECLQNFIAIDEELTEKSAKNIQCWWKLTANYILAVTLNQDHMIFADFSVNSESISLKFCKAQRPFSIQILSNSSKDFAKLY